MLKFTPTIVSCGITPYLWGVIKTTNKIHTMKTIIFISESKKASLELMKLCLKNSISFEFLNGNEFYFNIYDDEDFEFKRSHLGDGVINLENLVN